MQEFIDRIKQDGVVLPGEVLKVDSFFNHQVDVALMEKIGETFYEKFKDKNITKIVTVESSGIPMAAFTAQKFGVPFIFAKKSASQNQDFDVYESEVYSYTRQHHYTIRISKPYLSAEDNILVLDDFLARGSALKGLLDVIEQSGASVKGIGIGVEKGFQKGGTMIRNMGYEIFSLAIIESMTDDSIVLKEDGNDV